MANKKQDKEESQQVEKRKIAYVEAAMPTIYVNHAQMSFSNIDASFLLGEIAGVDETGIVNIVPRAKMIVSLQFLKNLSELINSNIEAFEKQNGAIQDITIKRRLLDNDNEVAH